MTADTDDKPAGLVTDGRWLHTAEPNEMVLDVTFARQYGIAVGQKIWLQRSNPNGPRRAEFTVVGLAVDVTNCLQPDCAPSNLWVHEAALGKLGTLRWSASQQSYRLDRASQAPRIAREAFLTYGRDLRVATTSREIRTLVTLVNGLLGTVVAGFGLFALVASAILISSTTSTRLAGLRRDLGLLQVVGATGRDVAAIVLAQNVAIGAMAAVLGWGISFVLRDRFVVGAASALPAVTSPWLSSLAAVFVAVFVIVLASTIIPVIRTARLEPVEALRPANSRQAGPGPTRATRVVPSSIRGLAWQTLMTQRRHFAIAGVALVLTGAAGVVASGYDAALSGFASGARQVGVRSDFQISSDNSAERERLDAALSKSPLVAAWWTQTLRPVLVSGQTVQARFVDGSFSDLGLTIRDGRLPTAKGEGVIGYGLATAAHIRVGDIVTVVAENRTFPIRVVGQVVDGSNVGRSITLFLSELPADTHWAMARVMRFIPGTNLNTASASMLSTALGFLSEPHSLGVNANRVKPYRLALYAMAAAVMAVGIAQLVASLLLATRARARDLGTLRTLGIDDSKIICAHMVVAMVVAMTASALALPLGARFYRASVDGIASGVGIGPGVALPSPVGGHLKLSLVLVSVCALLALLTVRRQLRSSIAAALRSE